MSMEIGTIRSVSLEGIQQLFARTLEGAYDDDEPWQAVRVLHQLGTREVFDVAVAWCESVDLLKRARGIDVIAQIGKTSHHQTNSFPEESFTLASGMLQKENDVRPLASAIFALGHLDNPAAIPLVCRYATHGSAVVRDAVAFALGSFPNDPGAIEGLIALTTDSDGEVRDWATFGLGVLGDTDTTRIRDVLAARIVDENQDAREEALVALARRHDGRALPPLIEMLSWPEPGSRILEAAAFMLELDRDGPEMTAHDYLADLKERFPCAEPSSNCNSVRHAEDN